MLRPARRSGLVTVAALLVVTMVAGCGGEDPPRMNPAPVGLPATVPTEATTLDAPTEQPTATPTPTPSKTRKAAPTPTPKRTKVAGPRRVPEPPKETKVPPPPPKAKPACTAPTYSGSQASRSQVKTALANAAAKTYWPTSAPDIKIPLNLVKATAWQESGWQSNIIACDGGIGLMQVMPATAEWMNQRFGQSYDVRDHQGNAYLGANYLAWLTKYIGDMYFDSDFSLSADNCTEELNSCLLNAVISAYNYGHGAVAAEGRPLTIPNPRYVYNVRALMTECECLAF